MYECMCRMRARLMRMFFGSYADLIAASSDTTVQNGQAWRALNFAIENTLQLAEFAANFVRFFTCPEDFTGAVKTACAAAITFALFVSQLLVLLVFCSSLKIWVTQHLIQFWCVAAC